MPSLIWVTISNTCSLQRWHPCFLPNCIGTSPGFICFRVFKNYTIFHKRELLLVIQSVHASLFNSTFLVPALVLVFLITPTTLADCTCAVFSMKSISLHLNAHNSELLNPVLMANWNKFFHCSCLAAVSRAKTSLGDKGQITQLLLRFTVFGC